MAKKTTTRVHMNHFTLFGAASWHRPVKVTSDIEPSNEYTATLLAHIELVENTSTASPATLKRHY